MATGFSVLTVSIYLYNLFDVFYFSPGRSAMNGITGKKSSISIETSGSPDTVHRNSLDSTLAVRYSIYF
jgi:hypothetical protein